MSKNILVVGSINVDYVINTDRLPKLGETITGHGFSMKAQTRQSLLQKRDAM